LVTFNQGTKILHFLSEPPLWQGFLIYQNISLLLIFPSCDLKEKKLSKPCKTIIAAQKMSVTGEETFMSDESIKQGRIAK